MSIPKNLKYTNAHAWVKLEEDGLVRVGITDFAQQQLGDLVFIDLPKVGRHINVDELCVTLESVKTASELPCPITGEIIAINNELDSSPEQVNDDAYSAWLFCIKADNLAQLDPLLDADTYFQQIND